MNFVLGFTYPMPISITGNALGTVTEVVSGLVEFLRWPYVGKSPFLRAKSAHDLSSDGAHKPRFEVATTRPSLLQHPDHGHAIPGFSNGLDGGTMYLITTIPLSALNPSRNFSSALRSAPSAKKL
jgi:hypothetical protein